MIQQQMMPQQMMPQQMMPQQMMEQTRLTKVINENQKDMNQNNISIPKIIHPQKNKLNNNGATNLEEYGKPYDYKEGQYIVWEFNDPNPWTRIVYKYSEEYPYFFYIKVVIPSLNDYQNWKSIIPNLIFNPNSGELIIPTKESI